MQRELLPRKGVGNAIFCAERLAITEVGRVQIEAQMMSYDVMGYDSLEVVTEPGACDICKPHDGEIVSVKDAQMGVNIPLFHPFCKCSTVAHMSRESLEKEFEKYEKVAENDELGIIKAKGNYKLYPILTGSSNWANKKRILQELMNLNKERKMAIRHLITTILSKKLKRWASD